MTMTKAFTLVELLVVVAIMGLLGTASVGGYRQMQRGIELRGVTDNVERFLTLVASRAKIDRLPTAIYYWNETLRSKTDTESPIVVGRAVAIRVHGRISAYEDGMLIDEFNDLETQVVTFEDDEQTTESQSGGTAKASVKRLYRIKGDRTVDFANVSSIPEMAATGRKEYFLTRETPGSVEVSDRVIGRYGYKVDSSSSVSKDWVGDAYGFEFFSFELPHGFLFGRDYSDSAENPIRNEKSLVFTVDSSSGSLQIFHLRPNALGQLEPQSEGTVSVKTSEL